MIDKIHENDLISLLETLKDTNESQTHFRKCANEREKIDMYLAVKKMPTF